MRFVLSTFAAATVFYATSLPAEADVVLAVGDPTSDGTVTVRIVESGGLSSDAVMVNITAADDAETKRDKIVNKFSEIGVNANSVAGTTDQLRFDGGVITVGVTFDDTGEFDALTNLFALQQASIFFGDRPFSESDSTGLVPSLFEAAIFTVDPSTNIPIILNASATSEVVIAATGGLSGFNVASVLFGQLQAQKLFHEQDLGATAPFTQVLSQGSGVITFDFNEVTPATIIFGTSSPTGSVGGSMTAIPEPSSFAFIGVVAVGVLAWCRLSKLAN